MSNHHEQNEDGQVSRRPKSELVIARRISCDGGGGALGHPKVWLDMGQDTSVTCKYCGKVFELDENAVEDAH